jgi:hypothetical protein
MLNASGMRSEREMRKIKNNVLIDKQSVGVLNRTLRSLGSGVSAMAGAAKNSQTFFKEYAMAAEEFRLNKQNVAALAISSVAGAPIGYLASKIFETETVKNLMHNIKAKSGDMIRRALKRDKSSSGNDDYAEIPRMQKGGYVKKGGYAKLHAAEVVMPVEKLLRELQEQRKLNDFSRKTGTGGGSRSNMATDISAIAKSTAETTKVIKTMSRGSLNLEKNMVSALGELKVAMIGTTDQWRIKMQSALLRHPIIKKYMMASDMLKTFMSTPLRWLFGKRGGYEGAASAAQKTDNVFEKSSNLLSLIFRYQMPRLDKIINLLQIGFEDKINVKIKGAKTLGLRKKFGALKVHGSDQDEEGKGVYTQAQIIKKWMEGKHKTKSMWERFVESEYIGLGTDDLEAVGIGGFGDISHGGKIKESLGFTSENIKSRKIEHSINGLKHKLRFTKSEEGKKAIERKIKALERLKKRNKKKKTKETPSMAAGGIIEKSGYIKAHAAEVVMPIEKMFNIFKQRMKETPEEKFIRLDRESEHAKMIKAHKQRLKAGRPTAGERIEGFSRKYFGAGAKTNSEINQAKIERSWKIKEMKEWLKFRKDTSKTLGTIKEKSTEQVKKTSEVVKEIKDMGGGFLGAAGSILGGLGNMAGGILSSAVSSVAAIGGGILGTIGLTKLGGKLGGLGAKAGKGAGFFKGGGLKAGYKLGSAIPAGAGALMGGGLNLASSGIKGIGSGLAGGAKGAYNMLKRFGGAGEAAGIGKTAGAIGSKGLDFAKKGGMFALKGMGKGLAGTAGLGLGLGAGVVGGIGKGALSLLKAAGKAGPLAGLLSLYDAYDMAGEAKDMGVHKASAGIGGLLSSGREGGIGQGIWGMFKGAGLGGLIGGIIGSVIFPGVGTAVGAAMGAKIGTVAGAGFGWLGGDKIAKSIDSTVNTVANAMGTFGDKNDYDLNEDPNSLERERGDGLFSSIKKWMDPTAGKSAAEQIDMLQEKLKKDPNMLPTQRREIEEKIQALEMTTRGQKYGSRFYDPKEGKETKSYEMTDYEKFTGVPLVSIKDRVPSNIAREYVKSGSGKELTDKASEQDAEKAKQFKDMGKEIVKPMLDEMDLAKKNTDKNNKMLANTIINSSQSVSNTISSSNNTNGGGQGGFSFGAGGNDTLRLLYANVS